MVAVGKGYIDIVTMLHVCPLIDINHQDNDGNTALMIAAQAGMSNKYIHPIQHEHPIIINPTNLTCFFDLFFFPIQALSIFLTTSLTSTPV